ncbi:uncharacterized protein LOC128234893 [Mya arenaria]|uniref:uncharacterized protein LOC128234893 n=1 Tax=Mya arenaria TaxID=6604 RepID=UPI0022DFE358|nr:uncharacterized protein LOC128234893 [Mya arenaria]
MGMTFKGIPVVILVGLGLLSLGGLLHLIGLATPYWYSMYYQNNLVKDGYDGHHGLWVTCRNLGPFGLKDCQSHGSGDLEVAGFIQATRALEILALLFGIVCILVTGLWFILAIQKHRMILMISSLGSGFLCALFGIIGIIVYGAEVNNLEDSLNKESTGYLWTLRLDWSFALCTVSSIIAVISVILIAVGTRMTDR